jgi:hypothetical protein
MSNCPFCNLDQTPNPPAPKPGDAKPPIGLLRRTWQGIQWLFPALLLVFMPKCPMCVAAYIALFTGIGVTVSTAHWIQLGMLTLCIAALAFLAGRFWLRRFKSRSFLNGLFHPFVRFVPFVSKEN